MDIFLEQIVVKKNTGIDLLKKVGIIVAGLIIIVISLFVLPAVVPILGSISFVFAAGAIYGMWFLLTSFNVEYEYILTNGEIDIDKIVAKRKRKRLITVNCRNFLEFGKYNPQNHAGQTYNSTILACTSIDAPNTYYAVTDHKKYGKCLLVFNPNEKIVEHAKQFMKRSVIKD